jgi:hypothetical protein
MTGADCSLTASVSAPIAIFAFRRPDHTRRLLQSLKRCEGFSDSRVFVFLDGPRTNADVQLVEETSGVLRAELGTSVEIHACAENRGLSQQVLSGVKYVLEEHERIIVLEDDLFVHEDFLSFVNAALEFYESSYQVLQVSGHTFEVPGYADRTEAFLFPLTTTWGWATWRRAWSEFREGAPGAQALKQDRQLRKRFNLDGNFDYATMLERQQAGRINSWGIQWYWNFFQLNGLTCFPPRSLVENCGADGSGTHGKGWRRFLKFRKGEPSSRQRVVFRPCSSMSVDPYAWNLMKQSIRKANGGALGALADLIKHKSGI